MFVDKEESVSPTYLAFWKKLGRREFSEGQYRRLAKAGRLVWLGREIGLQASYKPILDAGGKLCKLVKFATDVTDQVSTVEAVQAVTKAALGGNLTRRLPRLDNTGHHSKSRSAPRRCNNASIDPCARK